MGQRSVVEVDRLLVAVPMAPSSCRIETMTPHEYASHSPAIAAPLLACITAHSTCITPRHHHFRRRSHRKRCQNWSVEPISVQVWFRSTRRNYLSATRFVVSSGCHVHDAGAVIGVAIGRLVPMVAWWASGPKFLLSGVPFPFGYHCSFTQPRWVVGVPVPPQRGPAGSRGGRGGRWFGPETAPGCA